MAILFVLLLLKKLKTTSTRASLYVTINRHIHTKTSCIRSIGIARNFLGGEGLKTEAPKSRCRSCQGGKLRRWVPPSQPIRRSGERCKLLKWDSGKQILVHFELERTHLMATNFCCTYLVTFTSTITKHATSCYIHVCL